MEHRHHEKELITSVKVLFAAIVLTFVLVGAAITAGTIIVQPAVAGDSDDGGSGTGGGAGGQNP